MVQFLGADLQLWKNENAVSASVNLGRPLG